MVDLKKIKEDLFSSPLSILSDCLNNVEVLNFCNSILPYSIGIEIESDVSVDARKYLQSLDFYCIEKNIQCSEQTFRIPNGYKGLLCLELFSLYLKKYQNNTNSGNHYHVDCTNNREELFECIKKERNFVISELVKWGTKDDVNTKTIGEDRKFTYCNLRTHFQTAEFRVGELTCDFSLLLKRILSCSYIISEIRNKYNLNYNIVYDNDISLNYILSQIELNDLEYIEYTEKEVLRKIEEKKKKKQEVKKVIAESLLPNETYINNKVIKFY
jgi:hypothetical protein